MLAPDESLFLNSTIVAHEKTAQCAFPLFIIKPALLLHSGYSSVSQSLLFILKREMYVSDPQPGHSGAATVQRTTSSQWSQIKQKNNSYSKLQLGYLQSKGLLLWQQILVCPSRTAAGTCCSTTGAMKFPIIIYINNRYQSWHNKCVC